MHCIEANDKGKIAGFITVADEKANRITPAWHQHKNYEILSSRTVPENEAAEIFNTPLKKVQSYTPDMQPINGAFHIVRTDTGEVVVPMVGNQFEATGRNVLWNSISENFMASYSDLGVESVGTLSNAQYAFINFKVNEMTIRGDDSPSVNRLMFVDPLGLGRYTVNLNSVRVVCMNTLRCAQEEGVIGETMFKISHTKGAQSKIETALDYLANIKLKLKKFESDMNELTQLEVDSQYVDDYLEYLFPVAKSTKKDGELAKRSKTISLRKSNAIKEIFESDQGLLAPVNRSRYSLLQATTNFAGNYRTREKMDALSTQFDGLVGGRADLKDKALKYLMQTA